MGGANPTVMPTSKNPAKDATGKLIPKTASKTARCTHFAFIAKYSSANGGGQITRFRYNKKRSHWLIAA
jgi:hypothetical protein